MKKDKKLIAQIQKDQHLKKQSTLFTQRTSQLLQPENQITIQAVDDRPLIKYNQDDIKEMLPLENIHNIFKLDLPHGPYKLSISLTNTYLAGQNGHIANFNWRTKHPECEFNVKEHTRHIQHVAQGNFIVAQKDSAYMYDPKGTELHKMRSIRNPLLLEYLPYHYLFVALSTNGQLHYHDLTKGDIVNTYKTTQSPLCMKQNPWNSIIGIGDSLGVVRMYSPNQGQSLLSILCHKSGVNQVSFTVDGQYMVTSGSEGLIKIWDLRTQKLMDVQISIPQAANKLCVSQKNIIAACIGKQVITWKNAISSASFKPYLKYEASSKIFDAEFIPHEDYFAIAKQDGYEQIIIPESGDPNFDTYEQYGFQTKKQQKESHIKSLLEKLPASSITLNPDKIGSIDRTAQQVLDKEKQQEEEQLLQKKIKRKKKKMRGRSTTKKNFERKQFEKLEEQQKKWQNILSENLRVRKAEKVKQKQQLSILKQLEELGPSEFLSVVKY